jgi:antibiotic biosynthesis monooxygenase (ABM) superfamily enzyme
MWAGDEQIGVIVSRRVPVPQQAMFEALLRELMRLAAQQPGHLAGDVVKGPLGPAGRDYHIIYRFADEASLRAWDNSPQRRALTARIEPLALDAGRRELTGMEAWFDLPPGQNPPSRHRMALLTWIAIWPLVSSASWVLAPWLNGLPFLARSAATSFVVVVAMTYVVMPRLTGLVAPWLQPRAPG